MAFDNTKDEMITFTRGCKPDLRRKLTDVRIIVRGHTQGLNIEATRWPEVYLNTGLQFQAHKSLSFEKVMKMEDTVRRLMTTNALEPCLIRRIQIAAVQVVALYGAKLW